jgi:hypothetical protein
LDEGGASDGAAFFAAQGDVAEIKENRPSATGMHELQLSRKGTTPEVSSAKLLYT